MFGGNITSNRSKNINGYVVRWNTLTSPYDWFHANIDYNEVIPRTHWGGLIQSLIITINKRKIKLLHFIIQLSRNITMESK